MADDEEVELAAEDDLLDDEPPPPSANRWQYRVVNIGVFNAPQRLAMILGQLGAQGWELVHVYDKASNWMQQSENGLAIFKRPVAPGEHPEGAWAAWTRASTPKLLKAAPKGTPESWLDDPSGRHVLRWWDGRAWTAWVCEGKGTDPMEDPPVVDMFG
jgi:hypothetical protein